MKMSKEQATKEEADLQAYAQKMEAKDPEWKNSDEAATIYQRCMALNFALAQGPVDEEGNVGVPGTR